jgi:LPXTG-motif cell wall-anchored protein
VTDHHVYFTNEVLPGSPSTNGGGGGGGNFYGLTISKTVAGAGVTEADREALFPFELISAANRPVQLTAESPRDSLKWVALSPDGTVAADRITNNADGNPTVLWLKDGETATVYNLSAGRYQVAEWPAAAGAEPDGRFITSYRVSGGAAVSGTAAAVALDSGRTVAFTNTVAPDAPENPELPEQPPVVPVTPDTPVTPAAPDTPSGSETDSINMGTSGSPTGGIGLPKTGAGAAAPILALALSILGTSAAGLVSRRRRQTEKAE